MSLELALNNAITGLNVNQASLSVVSQNIANANTEGYSRKHIEQSAQYVGNQGVGTGVRIDDIARKVDTYLLRTTRSQMSETANTDIINDYMDRMQVLLGQPGDVNTLNEYVTTFFNDLQSLADTPERVSFRESAVSSGIVLAREISDLAEGMHDLRFQADNDISESVNYMNDLLRDLEEVNLAILHADVLGNPISGLQDEQDSIIASLSELVDVDVLKQENGEVYVYAANGIVLLDGSSYELEYQEVSNIEQFIDGEVLNPITIHRLNDAGERIGTMQELVSSGVSASITTDITQGKLRAYLDMRDSILPEFISQLDELSATLRDAFNAVHNNGSSFPGAHSLEGTRLVNVEDAYDWEGRVRLSVLDGNGQPIRSPFLHEAHTGVRPLELDMSFLDGGQGAGRPTMQVIVDEINNHFNPPTTKVEIGALNNVQLVSVTDQIPNATNSFQFDFDMENISALDADVFVGAVRVLDHTGADITNTTSDRPSVTPLQYRTNQGSYNVTVTAANHALSNGDFVYMEQPAAPIGTIPATAFPGYFQVSNVVGDSFDITTGFLETAPGVTVTAPGTELIYPTYDTIAAGEKRRVRDSGTITADLSGNPNAPYYDISVDIGVFDSEAATVQDIRSGTVTYRIYNNRFNLMNDRYDHVAASGPDAARYVPDDITPYMRAMLVDADGNELPTANGDYIGGEGFLHLVAADEAYTIAIDELDSRQLGIVDTVPRTEGTNRGFSHYFELNNFFKNNSPTATGDTTQGTAIDFQVEQRLVDNANLISLGTLERSTQPTDPDAQPLYTYERRSGGNDAIQRLADVHNTLLDFSASGGLDSSRQTVSGYIGEVLAYYGSRASSAELVANDNQTLLDGFTQRLDAITGVNVDEELANTIIYQNAYNASARVISVTSEMFDALFDSIR